MGQPYVGEIKMVGFNFAPVGWYMCNGQILAIAENETLFNLIGTTYGGDGQNTFQLPDLRSRIPLHMGNNGTSTYTIGESAGVETVTLSTAQVPSHTHQIPVSTAGPNVTNTADSNQPLNNFPGKSLNHVYGTTDNSTLNASSVEGSGGSQPHSNQQPFLTITYIISAFGVYPSP